MSIFDDNVSTPLPLPTINGKTGTPDALFNKIKGLVFINSEERRLLESFYQCHVVGEGSISLMDIIMESDIDVIISDALQEMGTVDYPVNPFPTEDGRVLILGQYEPKKKCITLFIKSIRYAAEENRISSSYLLQAVFAHELYHAYFQKNKYVPEIEEPLAEFGSLLYMRILFKDDKDNIEALLEMIEKKEKHQSLQYYSLGATLFRYLLVDSSIIKVIVSFKNFDLSRVSSKGDRVNEFNLYKHKPAVESFLPLLC